MMQWLSVDERVVHPMLVTEVERLSLIGELRQCLLSHSSKDPRIQQQRKDVHRGQNKAPETFGNFLVDAFNSGKPIADQVSSTIAGFFSPRINRLQRKLRDLMQVETVEEGQLNNIQMRVAQGDLSRPALVELKKEVCENRAILDEMIRAIDVELYPPVAH